jgi:hypothetical protein
MPEKGTSFPFSKFRHGHYIRLFPDRQFRQLQVILAWRQQQGPHGDRFYSIVKKRSAWLATLLTDIFSTTAKTGIKPYHTGVTGVSSRTGALCFRYNI